MENEKISQIGFSDQFSYCNTPIKYEITESNTIQLYVEDCARALGVTETKTATGNTTVRWNRVYDDLVGIEKIANAGEFKNLDKDMKKHIRDELKSMTISESELYLWSFRVDSEQGKKFRDWLATIVLPNLREHGIYVNGMENMTPEEVKRVTDERIESYILRKHGINIRKSLTDTIKKYINPSPSECDRYNGGFTNIVYKVLFGLECKPYKALIGAKEKDNLRDYLKDNHMDKEINYITKAEDFMSNLIMSGVKDEKMLKSFLTNWYSNVAE
jgi:prophage antirepressor-like protein